MYILQRQPVLESEHVGDCLFARIYVLEPTSRPEALERVEDRLLEHLSVVYLEYRFEFSWIEARLESYDVYPVFVSRDDVQQPDLVSDLYRLVLLR